MKHSDHCTSSQSCDLFFGADCYKSVIFLLQGLRVLLCVILSMLGICKMHIYIIVTKSLTGKQRLQFSNNQHCHLLTGGTIENKGLSSAYHG